jgi:nucleoid DNA-binding protein
MKKKIKKLHKKLHKVSSNGIKPIKETFTKSALIAELAESLTKDFPDFEANETKVVKSVLTHLENLILGSVVPHSVGEFMFPGLFKVTLRKVPARKAGVLVRNPATGEMIKGKAKPASVRVKIRALSKIKKAAIG